MCEEVKQDTPNALCNSSISFLFPPNHQATYGSFSYFKCPLSLLPTQKYFYMAKSYPFLRERERERERERNISVREKHQLGASCMRPNQGSNPQPRYVP